MPWSDDDSDDAPKKKPLKKRPAKVDSGSDISGDEFVPKKAKPAAKVNLL